MPKLGRRLGDAERKIAPRLLDLIPSEPPGIRFNEYARAARAIGFSKPTAWRHLTHFVELAVVIHEGSFYRRNPLYGLSAVEAPLIRLVAKGITRVRGDKFDLEKLRLPRNLDPWALRGYTGPSMKDPSDPMGLYNYLSLVLTAVASDYLLLLSVLRGAASLAAAREIANLFADGQMIPLLMMLARDVWEHRKDVPLEGLDGKEFNFTIQVER
jgi:hypothetical protein